MSNPSNLYAEKIFSEHPIALWNFDDKVDFLSLLSEEQKALSGWTVNNGSITTSAPSSIAPPVQTSPSATITSSAPTTKLTSPNIINAGLLDEDKDTINISTYFYASELNVDSVELGYEYTLGSSTTQVLETFNITASSTWAFLSKTFDKPEVNAEIRIVVKINANTFPSSFYINNLSFGQWSESFHTVTSGSTVSTLSSFFDLEEPALSTVYATKAPAYGLAEYDAYYLGSQNKLYASNQGFPLVYGAYNLTRVFPGDNSSPSIIFPGFGFMNNSGKYKDMTLEMWIRAIPNTTEARRIVGPIRSEDGLYLDGPFLTLKINDNIGSYFVGNWGRPMLVHIRIINNSATLLVNGEQVLEMSLDTDSLSYPTRIDNNLASEFYQKNQDWIGVYSYSDIEVLEVESAAIYSYKVPEVVAKRRWVYGQGVEFPDNANTAFGGTTALVDYRVANYANNYTYPDIGRWGQGVVDNASTENNTLSAPTYSLPEVILNNNVSYQDWILANSSANEDSTDPNAFINMSLADTDGGYLFLNNLNLLPEELKGIYGSFRSVSNDRQILMRIEDELTGNYFLMLIDDDSFGNSELRYELHYGDDEPIVVPSNYHSTGLAFTAGIDIDQFSRIYGNSIATFFSARSRLKLYVGGQPGFEDSFGGKIYRAGLATERNLNKISGLFASDGTAINISSQFDSYEGADEIYGGDYNIGIESVLNGGTPSSEYLLSSDPFNGGVPSSSYETSPEPLNAGTPSSEYEDVVVDFLDGGSPDSFATTELYQHVASYTIAPRVYLGSFNLDIASDSYWQDYVPLKYFAKNINNSNGQSSYKLDYLQFNIDNPVFDKFNNYSQDPESFDTDSNKVRTYVSFQYLASGANASAESFLNTEPAPVNRVVIPGSEWLTTKYEVVNDSIIYPPAGVAYDSLAIVTHIEIQVEGIQTSPIKLKSLQIASQALKSNDLTPIGTRFGLDVYPYYLKGIYYDYSAKNPLTIFKNTSPYLHLTNTSGISLRGNFGEENRGISIPINSQQAEEFKLAASQLLVRYEQSLFPETEQKLFEFNASGSKSIDIFVVASNSERTRGYVYAKDRDTQQSVPGMSMFINGKLVKDLYIYSKEWFMLSIQFADSLNFDSFAGTLNITGPVMFNNISNYRISADQTAISTISRTWTEVETMLDNPTLWGDFLNESPPVTWENVLYVPVIKQYLTDPVEIYKTYTGTNKTIIRDSSTFRFKDYSYRAYSNISWQSSIITPV